MDEAELSRAFPIGDGACLEAVIGRYGQALLRYCHHILCDYHEAQDAVQDALLRAWSRRNRFRRVPIWRRGSTSWLSRLYRPAPAEAAATLCPSPAVRTQPRLHRAGAAGGPVRPHAGGAGPGLRTGDGGPLL